MTVATRHLYLSRLILDQRSRQVWSELAQPYEMHRTLMRAFPKITDEKKVGAREEFGVLFRADIDSLNRRVIVYVQSAIEPDWSFLSSAHDYLIDDPDPPKDISKAYQKLRAGQILSFRLRANPTRRVWISKPGTSALRGQRVALCTEKEQIEWLIRKSKERVSKNGRDKESAGFELVTMNLEDGNEPISRIPRVTVRPEGIQTDRKQGEDGPRRMTHLAVCFDGVLRITDADAFLQTLTSGIGSAKAFGFGLLSIAPIRDGS